MTLKFYPEIGTILICDFKGFIEPEMVKRRPVVVISPKRKYGPRACIVVPLSTTDPRPVEAHHFKLTCDPPLPDPYGEPCCWVKGDMVYHVSFERLSLPFAGKSADGTRIYDQRQVAGEDLKKIHVAVANSLGIFL